MTTEIKVKRPVLFSAYRLRLPFPASSQPMIALAVCPTCWRVVSNMALISAFRSCFGAGFVAAWLMPAKRKRSNATEMNYQR
jgi:hypothetical protein